VLNFLLGWVLFGAAVVNLWALVTGDRLLSRQILAVDTVRLRAGGALLVIAVLWGFLRYGTAAAAGVWGIVVLFALTLGAGLWVSAEAGVGRRGVPNRVVEGPVVLETSTARAAVDGPVSLPAPQRSRVAKATSGLFGRLGDTPRPSAPTIDPIHLRTGTEHRSSAS
jgi:hypothetical protein